MVVTVTCPTALVDETRAATRGSAFVAPGWGTPSKTVFSSYCLVSGRQPARTMTASASAARPPKGRRRRRRKLDLDDWQCIGQKPQNNEYKLVRWWTLRPEAAKSAGQFAIGMVGGRFILRI